MHTTMNKIYLLIFLLIFTACSKDSKKEISQEKNIKNILTDSINKRNINIKSSEDFNESWSEIASFESELRRLLNTNFQTEKDIELLIKQLNDLKKTYPKRYKTPIIEARVKVLETEILILKQTLKDNVLSDLNNNSLRIQKAYNIFVTQIETQILKEKDYEKYR
jgi:hypothetical protein